MRFCLRAIIAVGFMFTSGVSDGYSGERNSTAGVSRQSAVGVYTTLSGYYDYQSNGGSINYIRVNPSNGYIHVIYMVSEDSANSGGPTRKTSYALSINGGASWNNFNQVRIPGGRRSGFPSMDIGLSSGITGSPIIANHSDPSGLGTNNFSYVYIDPSPGSGAFVEFPPTPPRGIFGQEPIWPYVAATANGSVVMAASPDISTGVGPDFFSVFQNFSTWTNWSTYPGRNQTGGRYPVAANGSGRVGIMLNVSNGSSGVYWLESTDNGSTWPGSPVELYGTSRIVGGESLVSYVHCDVVYNGDTPLFVMSEISSNILAPNPRILFYSQPTGYVWAAPWNPSLYIAEPLPQQRFHQYGVGWPSIAMSGSTIVVAYQVFQPEVSDSTPNYHYSDIWWVKSANGGLSWSIPENLTNTPTLDERYPSVSKWNAPGEFNIVWQEDREPGAHAANSDNATISRSYLKFMKVSTVDVDEEPDVPRSFGLSQNYPNPFNPVTQIHYTIENGGRVTLKVFSLLGHEVATVLDESLSPGSYATTFDGSSLPSGTYIYRLISGNVAVSRKMLLVK